MLSGVCADVYIWQRGLNFFPYSCYVCVCATVCFPFFLSFISHPLLMFFFSVCVTVCSGVVCCGLARTSNV